MDEHEVVREDPSARGVTPADREERRRHRRRKGQRRLLLLVVVVVAAAATAIALAARGGDGEPAVGEAGAGSGATTAPAPSPPPPVWAATSTRPAHVWIGGDSLAGELDWGLTPLLDDAGAFTTTAFYKGSSGICRYD